MAGEYQGRHEQPRRWSPWRVIGTVAAAVLIGAGLAFVGYIALLAIVFSSYGSNK